MITTILIGTYLLGIILSIGLFIAIERQEEDIVFWDLVKMIILSLASWFTLICILGVYLAILVEENGFNPIIIKKKKR